MSFFVISTGCTINAGTSTVCFCGSGAQVMTLNGEVLFDVDVSSTGALTLNDALVCDSLTVSAGSFDANDKDVTWSNDCLLSGNGDVARIAGKTDSTTKAEGQGYRPAPVSGLGRS